MDPRDLLCLLLVGLAAAHLLRRALRLFRAPQRSACSGCPRAGQGAGGARLAGSGLGADSSGMGIERKWRRG